MLNSNAEKKYDFILWGNIQRYKGIVEFLNYIHSQKVFTPEICIVGHCSDKTLESEIQTLCNSQITFIPQSIPFEEVGNLINLSKFVLVPYNPETILSSAILMDSLSFGAKVIGPDAGSFKDYASNASLRVYTYQTLSDLPDIYKSHQNDEVKTEDYATFLESNNWSHFIEKLLLLAESV